MALALSVAPACAGMTNRLLLFPCAAHIDLELDLHAAAIQVEVLFDTFTAGERFSQRFELTTRNRDPQAGGIALQQPATHRGRPDVDAKDMITGQRDLERDGAGGQE